MTNKVNKVLLDAILRKRRDSEQLNNEEEAYSRKLFNSMLDSKKNVRKVFLTVTGEQLRKEQKLEKSKTDAEATREDPRYPQGKNPVSIKNTEGHVDTLRSKIPDADEKPKQGPAPGYEQDRMASMTQEAIPPRSEAVKFTSANPVHKGDIVSKNMAREGTLIVKGIVLKVKDGIAFVKWANGRTMYEPAHLLVKVKEQKDDPKLGVPEKEEEDKNVPMTKNGDLSEAPSYMGDSSRDKTTPFQDLTSSLQDVVRLAGDLRGKADNTSDEDVKGEYEKLIGQLRGIAETILASLSSELAEAETDAE